MMALFSVITNLIIVIMNLEKLLNNINVLYNVDDAKTINPSTNCIHNSVYDIVNPPALESIIFNVLIFNYNL